MMTTVKFQKITKGLDYFLRRIFQHHMEELPYNLNGINGNETDISQPAIIVRAEEALIVVLVFALWIAAIILFFNRWGKIRMLEPYQPKFNQQHRSSCPLLDSNLAQHHSFSKFNLAGDVFLTHQKIFRPRQNSVFVGSSVTTFPSRTPRKVKSAFDLQNLIFSESSLTKSSLKINLNSDRCENVQVIEDRIDLNIGKSRKREQLHCFLNKEFVDNEILKRHKKITETKQRPNISKQNSTTNSRHNSITNQDFKTNTLHCLKLGNTERKSSLFLGPSEFFSDFQTLDLKDSRDMKNYRDKYRRNSMLLINSVGVDKYLLSPRESIKSGVIDFRRNSMIIINNLTEDLGCSNLGKDLSMSGSHLVLGSDLFKPDRRNSLIPPGSYETKQKVIHCQPFDKSKKIFKAKSNFFQPLETKYISSQKASKSLDCSESGRVVSTREKKETSQPILNSEIMQQLSVPSEFCSFEGSNASLNVDFSSTKIEPSEESHSSFNLDRICKIKETKYI